MDPDRRLCDLSARCWIIPYNGDAELDRMAAVVGPDNKRRVLYSTNAVVKPCNKRMRKSHCYIVYGAAGAPLDPVSVDPSPSMVFFQCSGRQTQTSGKALISPLTAGDGSRRPEVFETPLSR